MRDISDGQVYAALCVVAAVIVVKVAFWVLAFMALNKYVC